MSRFHTMLNRAYREIITEQDQPPVPPAPPQAAPEQAAPTPMPDIPEDTNQDQEVEPLSSESFVFLMRLLSKALMIERLDSEEEKKIVEFGDINENNARKALELFLPIIRRYSPAFESIPKI